MTKNISRGMQPRGLIWRLLGIMILSGLALVSLVACDDSEDFVPPPATIIRASDEAGPATALATKEPSPTFTSLPRPPTRPAKPAQTSPTRGYPLPAYTPKPSTPVVYPSASAALGAPKPKNSPTPVVYPTK